MAAMSPEQPAVAFVHTVAGLAPTFNVLARDVLPPATRTVHIVDEDLLQDTIRNGAIRPPTRERLQAYVEFAQRMGVQAVMVTCSSVGPVVDEIAPGAGLPVLRVDTAMADEAVRLGRQIGVLGTLSTTLEPTAALIRARAAQAGREVHVEARVAEGAFAALQQGQTAEHDRRVLEVARALLGQVDVLVLAQASMARVLEQLPAAERSVPVLSSPQLGVQRLAAVLAEGPSAPAAATLVQPSS
jgi:Asp/Glu/hydantoin racemase